jgi:hypothetical protein
MTLTGCTCGLAIRLGYTVIWGPKVWLHVQTGTEICPAGAAMLAPEPAPAADAFYEVTVRVRMTAAQRDEYLLEYGVRSAADDVADRLQADVAEALHDGWLREFTTVSVSAPRVAKPR